MTREEIIAKYAEDAMLESQLDTLDEAHDVQVLGTERERIIAKYSSERDRIIAKYQDKPESTDTLADDTLDVAGEFGQSGNKTVAQTIDFFTNPVRMGMNAVMPGSIPSLESYMEQLGALGNDYMEEGIARDAVRGAGSVAPVIGGFVPVTRASGSIASAGMDMAGLGMSTDDAATAAYKATMAARNKLDDVQLATPKTDDEIWEVVKASSKRQMVEGNRPMFEAAEARSAEVAAQMEKSGVSEVAEMIPVNTVKLPEVIQTLADRGVDGAKTLKVIAKKGGIRFPDELEFDELIAIDKQFSKGDGTGSNLGKLGYYLDQTFTPVANMIGKYGDSRVGAAYERATEKAMRAGTHLTREFAEPLQRVIKAVDDNPRLQTLLLDMHKSPKNLHKARIWIRDNLGSKDLKAFNKFIAHSNSRVAEANGKIYKSGAFDSDITYLHANKQAAAKEGFLDSLRHGSSPETTKAASTHQRNRPLTNAMTKEDYDLYDNVLVSHIRHLAEQEQLLELQKHLHLRPSLGKNDTFKSFFNEVADKLKRDGISDDKADAMAKIMLQAHEGSRKSPPPFMRAYMSGSYAGTLAQLKTSALNLHDVFVSMHAQGIKPTLKAITQTNKQVFGKSLEELGIGDAQSTGEFINQFDAMVSKPSTMDKVATGAKAVTEFSMKWSGFKAMDKIGKGVVLRSAVNNMKAAAKKGTLHTEFGDLADKSELMHIKKYLIDGTPIESIPKKAADIIEELAFTQLGKQQLITQAGRPLNYLKYPSIRPLYALTGFAIKQRAMVAQQMNNAPTMAGKAKVLASYSLLAGGGYGVINQSREALFKGEEPSTEGFLLDSASQVAAMATLNKMGDSYSAEAFMQDPVEFLMTAWLPPTGLQGAAAKSTASAFKAMLFDGEWDDAIVEKVPVMGDFYKYYWKDE